MADAAARTEVLEEANTEEYPPLAVLPGGLERITKTIRGSVEHSVAKARQRLVTHQPVVRYTLRDCLVHQVGVEYAGGRLGLGGSPLRRIPFGRIEEIPQALHCNHIGSRNFFGHWLTDACATALLAEDKEAVLLDMRPDWPDVRPYVAAFGLSPKPFDALHVRELHVLSDRAQGPLKRHRYTRMRAGLRRLLGVQALGPPRPVYLRRGQTGDARPICDEDVLCERLRQHGFEILDLASTEFTDRHRWLSAASVLVTIDGSHAVHAHMSLPSGSSLITLTPSNRFTLVHRGYAHAAGLRYGCVVVEPSADGYVVSPDEVLRTVDMLT